MATFFKFAVGAVILGAFFAFLFNQVRSFIGALRERRDKKSPEQVPTEPEKVDPQDGKGGASE